MTHPFIFPINIPAGGTDLCPLHHIKRRSQIEFSQKIRAPWWIKP